MLQRQQVHLPISFHPQLSFSPTISGMYPTDPLDAAEVDEVTDFTHDVELAIKPLWHITDESKKVNQ